MVKALRCIVPALLLLLGLLQPSAARAQRIADMDWQWPGAPERVIQPTAKEPPETLGPDASLAEPTGDSLGTSRIVLWGLGGLLVGTAIGIATMSDDWSGIHHIAVAGATGLGLGVSLAIWRNRQLAGERRSDP